MFQHVLGLNLADAAIGKGQGLGEIVLYFPVMGRLKRQADEIWNLILAFVQSQTAEIQILLHSAIF